MILAHFSLMASMDPTLLLAALASATTPAVAAALREILRGNRKNLHGSESLKRLAEFTRQLADSDCLALKRAISDLAHGRISAQLAIHSEPLETTAYPDVGDLADALNAIIAVLRQTAGEFNTMTETPCRRLCYVGADSFLEGMLCGETMGQALGGCGSVVIISSPGSMSLEMRVAGFQTRLRESFPGVDLARIVYCTVGSDKLCEAVQEETRNLLDTVPRLAGIYLTRGSAPASAARALEAAGRGGRVKIVAHDMLDETMQYLKKGLITATLGQDPYGQGHDPVIHLFNHLAAGWQPSSPRFLTQLDVVTQVNCDQFWKDGQGARIADASRYAKPADVMPRKPLRIAVVGRGDSPFFEVVRNGVLAAAAQLRSRAVTVDLIVPEENRRTGKISAEVYAPVVELVLQQRYDGLAIGIFDTDLVPIVNRVSQAGIPVITYNSEPAGLRSMISSSIEQSHKLLAIGRTMADIIGQLNNATLQVNASMSDVSQGAVSQTEQIGSTREALGSLLKHVAEVNHQAGQGAQAAESTAQAAHSGAQAIEKTLDSMKQIHESVLETSQNVEKLGGNSAKIDGIIKTISTVAYQIKLVGINASVEAAHGGEYGAGFSIVANEIRSLADRTGRATSEIIEVVKTVQSSIRDLQQVMSESLHSVQVGSALAAQAGQALGEIRQSVEQNRHRLGAVASSASKMQSFSNQVGQMMSVVASVSEKNAAAAEEVSAATREMIARLEDAGIMAENLAKIAEGEQSLLAKFTSSEKG
jgi:methyl-accepting chemotaxis protein